LPLASSYLSAGKEPFKKAISSRYSWSGFKMASDLIHFRLKSGLTIATAWQKDLGSSGREERSRVGEQGCSHPAPCLCQSWGQRSRGKETGSTNAIPGFS